jgi:hypothetical protein
MPDSIITRSAIERLRCFPAGDERANAGETVDTIIDVIDDCFGTMATLWQQGNYAHIVKECDALPLYCLCDIRICVYYLYSLWRTQKNNPFSQSLIILTKVIKYQHQTYIAERDTKNCLTQSKVLSNSVGLFFRKTLKLLESSSVRINPDDEDIAQVLSALADLQQLLQAENIFLDEDVDASRITITKYFSNIQDQLGKVLTDNSSMSNAESDSSDIEDEQAPPPSTRHARECQQLIELPSLNPSYPLQCLFKKIRALETLIENQQDLKAAIVLADIQTELDNFNPLVYLPEYFGGFAGLRAKYAGQLEPYFSHHKTYQWQVLHDYYRADIAAFTASTSENPNIASADPMSNRYQNYSGDAFEQAYTEPEYDE